MTALRKAIKYAALCEAVSALLLFSSGIPGHCDLTPISVVGLALHYPAYRLYPPIEKLTGTTPPVFVFILFIVMVSWLVWVLVWSVGLFVHSRIKSAVAHKRREKI